MTFPAITALLSIFICFLTVGMILNIAKTRRTERVELETGDSDTLTRAVRIHGNLVETSPLFLVMLGLLEMGRGHQIAIVILAIIFASSRIMHPIGLSGKEGTFKYRVYGIFLTISAFILTAIYLAVIAVLSF